MQCVNIPKAPEPTREYGTLCLLVAQPTSYKFGFVFLFYYLCNTSACKFMQTYFSFTGLIG